MNLNTNAARKNISELLNSLSAAKNQISLQAHLLNMDLKSRWISLEKKIQMMEQKLENQLAQSAEKIGQKEEQFFVGNQNEINNLVSEINAIKVECKNLKNH